METKKVASKSSRLISNILLTVTVLLADCESPSVNNGQTHVNDVQVIYPETAVVLNILIDISTSTIPVINIPDSSKCIALYNIAGVHPKSVLSLGNIGYTENSDKQFVRFDKLQIPLKNVNNGTMTQRKNAMDYNTKVKYVNEQKKIQFIQAFNAMSNRVDEQTDINIAIERSIRFLNEPNFKQHRKILILISDGYQITKGCRDVNVDFSPLPDVHIILVGWKNNTNGFRNVDVNRIVVFEGFQNVPDYISSILNTK